MTSQCGPPPEIMRILAQPLHPIPTDREDGPHLVKESIFKRRYSKRVPIPGAMPKKPDTMRDPNISLIFREHIEAENEKVSNSNHKKYLSFRDHRSDKEKNEYTKKLAEDALMWFVPEQYGKRTFRQCYRLFHSAMFNALYWLIREDQDVFDVYRQSERMRPIWKIIESRMNNTLRKERRKSQRATMRNTIPKENINGLVTISTTPTSPDVHPNRTSIDRNHVEI